ncbi:cell adhesion molecule 2-like isoform X2 [Planococcus citri]|uniref:cell adhesion molecule 2-like isoform X2 n=1 Tax=Planococcus citri TaxID=170843 RepID=UPI0031F887CB
MPTKEIIYVSILAILLANSEVCGLRLNRVVVPPYKLRGENAVLECHYDLDDDSLYAVKWYKENEEFYRFVPKSHPPQHSYKVEGIKVINEESDSHQVVLRSVTLKSSGLYRCEVSAEGPSFFSVQKEGRLEVVFLPREAPQISGEKKQYQIGDELNLNCSSGKSYPASVLNWYINDNQASDSNLLRYPLQSHNHGLVSSLLGLRMRLISEHFIEGSLRVRCVATVSPLLWQGNKESIFQKIDNREAMLLVRSMATQHTLSAFPWIVTVILARI